MRREAEVRELLIGNAIHLIAEGGFEKATTKELAYCRGSLSDLKMNEVYIYRLFGSKENLYEAAFLTLDNELFDAFKHAVAAIGEGEGTLRERFNNFFNMAWKFVLRNEEHCRCYVRYYYSIYFKGNSLETHKRVFREINSVVAPLFREEADVYSIFHSIFTTFLDFAIRVYNRDLVDDEINRLHIFNVLYQMMRTYFKESIVEKLGE